MQYEKAYPIPAGHLSNLSDMLKSKYISLAQYKRRILREINDVLEILQTNKSRF